MGRGLERRSLRRSLGVLGVITAVATVVFTFGPAYLRQGAFAVLVPVTGIEAASPYRIDVKPGSATIARGTDVSVAARLVGFTSTEVDLFTRPSAGAPFERTPMTSVADGGGFESTLFRVAESFDYFVQSAGVRSPVFRIDAAALPFVERMEMEFVFPAYTGLGPRTIDQGGDIAVLRGTTVRLRVHSTMATKAGRIVRDDREHMPLTVNADGTLSGSLQVKENGFYRIELATPAGALVSASPQYTIDVLADDPPSVAFQKPGRDLRATSLDEIFVEAGAEDDFGVRQLELVYTVNGGPEKQVKLVGPAPAPRAEVSAGHTFFLEELGLQPGDVVAYYARATDNDEVSGAKTVTSDIFFLQIQPFRKDYRAAESQAGGQPAGQRGNAGDNDPSALSEQQRRVVSGTFNVLRDRAKAGEEKFKQDVVFLALTQGQLRERAEGLSAQIKARVAQAEPTMVKVAGALEEAAKAMQGAEQRLQARDPKGALPGEQQALASLQRAEEAYRDVRVRMDQQRGGGGGGGGGQQSSGAAEELANLFQLEMDKLRNQYETFDRSQQQTADAKVDAMLERLKELARRQEQEAERQRQMAGNRQTRRQRGQRPPAPARRGHRGGRAAAGAALARGRPAGPRRRWRATCGRRPTPCAAPRPAETPRRSARRAPPPIACRRARDGLERQRTDRMARDIDSALVADATAGERAEGDRGDVRALDKAGADRSAQVQQLQARKDAEAGRGGRPREAARPDRGRLPPRAPGRGAEGPAGGRRDSRQQAEGEDPLLARARAGRPDRNRRGVRGADWHRHRVARIAPAKRRRRGERRRRRAAAPRRWRGPAASRAAWAPWSSGCARKQQRAANQQGGRGAQARGDQQGGGQRRRRAARPAGGRRPGAR